MRTPRIAAAAMPHISSQQTSLIEAVCVPHIAAACNRTKVLSRGAGGGGAAVGAEGTCTEEEAVDDNSPAERCAGDDPLSSKQFWSLLIALV